MLHSIIIINRDSWNSDALKLIGFICNHLYKNFLFILSYLLVCSSIGFILPSTLKYSSTRHRILNKHFFPSVLQVYNSSVFCFQFLDDRSTYLLFIFLLLLSSFLFITGYQFCPDVFKVIFLVFILLRVHWDSWIC